MNLIAFAAWNPGEYVIFAHSIDDGLDRQETLEKDALVTHDERHSKKEIGGIKARNFLYSHFQTHCCDAYHTSSAVYANQVHACPPSPRFVVTVHHYLSDAVCTQSINIIQQCIVPSSQPYQGGSNLLSSKPEPWMILGARVVQGSSCGSR